MLICATSDTHGILPPIPPCNLFIHAGDLCMLSDHSILGQSVFVNGRFKEWFNNIEADKKIIVPGNHDFVFEEAPYLLHKDITDATLSDQQTEYEGIKIWSYQYMPWFNNWAWNSPEYEPEQTEFLKHKCDLIPMDTDILVSHCPPKYVLDKTVRGDNIGNLPLSTWCVQNKPRIIITGHCHEGRGDVVQHGIRCYNVAYLDHNYKEPPPYGKPVLIDYDEDGDIPF